MSPFSKETASDGETEQAEKREQESGETRTKKKKGRLEVPVGKEEGGEEGQEWEEKERGKEQNKEKRIERGESENPCSLIFANSLPDFCRVAKGK